MALVPVFIIMVNSITILLMIFIIAFASNMESVAQILYNGIGRIPKEYQINWTNAGLLPENRPS
ncbi:MAG: hypothetical protein JSW07_11305, partial [bacterium]